MPRNKITAQGARSCVLAIAASLIFILGLTACRPEEKATDKSQAAPLHKTQAADLIELSDRQIERAGIKTATVTTGKLAQELEFSSVVEAPSDDIGIVSPLMNGVVSRVLVDVGDTVRTGQPLLYVTSPDVSEAQAAYLHALSKLQEVKAQAALIDTRLELAKKDVARLAALVQEGISANKDLEASQARMATTKAELVATQAASNAALAELNAARIKLRALGIAHPSDKPDGLTTDLPLTSPRNGVVIQRAVTAGQGIGPTTTMAAGHTGALLSIASLDKVWVMLEVPQSQASTLRVGAPVTFISEIAPEVAFKGKITRIGQHFDPTCHCLSVRTEIDNGQHLLKPGMLIIAKVASNASTTEHKTIATAAIQNIDGNDYVFVEAGHGRYRRVPVAVIKSNADEAQISGIAADARVVVNGAFQLKTESVKNALAQGGLD
jgi:cobalt-zinc-cadmium efflux system membrane fusion protein